MLSRVVLETPHALARTELARTEHALLISLLGYRHADTYMYMHARQAWNQLLKLPAVLPKQAVCPVKTNNRHSHIRISSPLKCTSLSVRNLIH